MFQSINDFVMKFKKLTELAPTESYLAIATMMAGGRTLLAVLSLIQYYRHHANRTHYHLITLNSDLIFGMFCTEYV